MALIRIVRMHFTAEGLPAFLTIFQEHKEAIRNFSGCLHLELLKDSKDPLLYTTLSYWQDDASLERYRQSALFSGIWGKVKPLFSRQPEAFSLLPFITL